MNGLRLYKAEKLCSTKQIESLFDSKGGAHSALAYPLRALWMSREPKADTAAEQLPRFLIVVPKRRLRHAVDRVAMRRRIREAYRLHRHLFPRDCRLNIAFVYVADGRRDNAAVVKAMTRLLTKINETVSPR